MKATAKILASFAVLGLAASTFGASLTLTTTNRSNGGNGGSYTATNFGSDLSTSSYSPASGVATATSFETFCLEPTEYFSPGSPNNFTIASAAIGGATNNHGGSVGDPLSIGTTWLYSQFAQGTLFGYNYGTDTQRQASNLNLQRAIWYLEDDYSYTDPLDLFPGGATGNPFLLAVANQFLVGPSNAANLTASLAAAQSNASDGLYGVYVLNLTTGQTNNQSQLYYHVSSVPEGGATAGLLGLSLLTFAALRRRFVGAR